MRNLPLHASVLSIALALTVHGASTADAVTKNTGTGSVTSMTIVELLEMMLYEDTRLVDVRGRGAYLAGHIIGAFHLQPTVAASTRRNASGDTDVAETLRIAGITTSTNIVIYDALSGHQARQMADTLRQIGYTKVSLLAGGLSGWVRNGGSVVKGPGSSWSPLSDNAP